MLPLRVEQVGAGRLALTQVQHGGRRREGDRQHGGTRNDQRGVGQLPAARQPAREPVLPALTARPLDRAGEPVGLAAFKGAYCLLQYRAWNDQSRLGVHACRPPNPS
jgi:hypothetical protein